MGSYPSTEKQSVYTTASADWAKKYFVPFNFAQTNDRRCFKICYPWTSLRNVYLNYRYRNGWTLTRVDMLSLPTPPTNYPFLLIIKKKFIRFTNISYPMLVVSYIILGHQTVISCISPHFRLGLEYANSMYLWQRGKTPTKREVLCITLNCMWWWGSSSGDLRTADF